MYGCSLDQNYTPQIRIQQPSIIFSEGNQVRSRTEKNNSTLISQQDSLHHVSKYSSQEPQMATIEQTNRANKIIQKYHNAGNTFSPRGLPVSRQAS